MKNHNQSVEINNNSDHLYRILIIGGSRSGNANVIINLIKKWTTRIDKIYLNAVDAFISKYQLLIEREKVGIEILKNAKVSIDNSQTIDDADEIFKDYNSTRKRRMLIVFDVIISAMESNEKLSSIVTEFFLRGRKLIISLAFISQFYFKVPKTIRLNTIHYFKNF